MPNDSPELRQTPASTVLIICLPVMVLTAIMLSCGEIFLHRSRGNSFERAISRERDRQPLLRRKRAVSEPVGECQKRSWFWQQPKAVDAEQGLSSTVPASTFLPGYGTFLEGYHQSDAAATWSIDFNSLEARPVPLALPPRSRTSSQHQEFRSSSTSTATATAQGLSPCPESFADRYKLLKTLTGNFCESVHLVRHRISGVTHIIKQLPCDIDSQGAVLWPLEADFMAEMSHPNIVALDSVIIDRTGRYPLANVVMQHCNGGDLEDHISHLRFRGQLASEPFIMHFISCMIEALAYMHHGETYNAVTGEILDNGLVPLVHRDIKPQNIFLNFENEASLPQILLGDFGLSSTASSSRGICGTPGYMAPESQIPSTTINANSYLASVNDTRIMTSATDIWTFGATLFYLLTGTLFKPGITDLEAGFRTSNVTDHPEILALLEGCLEEEPEKRLKANEAGMRRMTEYLKGEVMMWEESRVGSDA